MKDLNVTAEFCLTENNVEKLREMQVNLNDLWNERPLLGYLVDRVVDTIDNDEDRKRHAPLEEYNVEICRITHASLTITVNASTKDEAREAAIDEAGSYDFGSGEADYEVEHVVEHVALG